MTEKELIEMRKIIMLTLIKIGIRCDLIGFTYLCRAIEHAILKPDLLHKLCKKLYVIVGNEYNVQKVNSVERSMRHAIENAYISNNFSEINKMFKANVYNKDEKPTVGGLIKLIVEYYKMGLYKEYITI